MTRAIDHAGKAYASHQAASMKRDGARRSETDHATSQQQQTEARQDNHPANTADVMGGLVDQTSKCMTP